MVNPYFIETKSVQPALAGLGNTLAQFGELQKKKALERDMSHLQQAFQVGDLEKIAELSAKNPVLRQEAVQNFEFSNKQSEQAANMTASRIMATQDPVMALEALSQGVDDVVGKVGKARMMRRDLARLQEAIDSEDPAKAQQVLRNIQSTAAFLMPNALNTDDYINTLRNETRKDLVKDMAALYEKTTGIKTNFGKIQNLAADVASGNRQAVAPLIIASVKLGDDSTVMTGEMLAQLNAQGIKGALLDGISGDGDMSIGQATKVLQQNFDTLNPENIDVTNVLNTAQSIAGVRIPEVLEEYKILQGRGMQGRLRAEGYNSIFTPERQERYQGLSSLKFDAQAALKKGEELRASRAELTPQQRAKLNELRAKQK